ncbi:MAG: beta-ketoacyl-[acyl-carrier-protein] synthase II [Firmicutes bacterium HGW-Firmicutes-11]|jgi:3-oxoacyl-[acyl-carrier-protein] synthase II|nr:MAG: beta-ketoacyl-[acyl-carrier-protein] synthase II [Firmicutes bacterium HGW-Firmicutes-11]
MHVRRVAVTGVGILSPIGNDLASFHKNLMNGVCGIDYITKFDTEEFKVKIAAEVKGFDPAVYMDKSEARRMDMFSQYAMAAAEQAVQDSGISGTIETERLGVYVGSGIGGMDTFISMTEKLLNGGPRKVSPLFIPMMISNIAAGNIAIRFQAMGPCLPVVTACSTSTHAIGEAFHAIRHGYADAIIAGGAEAAINPLSIAGFTNSTALSTRNEPLSSSIPFDLRRDGFVIGEGAAILVLEEYDRASARGAKIYGEIVGYGNTCDAHHITAPHPEAAGAANSIKIALKEAGYQEEIKVYYNAHGTSTPLNDKAETVALKRVFGDKAKEVHISSTKSMTGHMLGAAGATEAIACLLALSDQRIPPTIGYQEADPDCDLNYTPNHAVDASIDLALSTSLGFGGHNGTLAFRR